MDITSLIKNGRLTILVKPNSNKTEIIGWDDSKQALRVNINAIPDKNKANDEVVKFFQKLLKKKLRIKSGLKSRKKVLEIV